MDVKDSVISIETAVPGAQSQVPQTSALTSLGFCMIMQDLQVSKLKQGI